MPTIPFSRFPAAERARVEAVLGRAQLTASEVKITKTTFSCTSMPQRIGELVTCVCGSVSRTYEAAPGGSWIKPFARDLDGGSLRATLLRDLARSHSPGIQRGTGLVFHPGTGARLPTRLLRGAIPREDDEQVLAVIRSLCGLSTAGACRFRAVILNEQSQAYREVDLHGVLDSVQLTAGLNAMGFRWEAARREGRSPRYDWRFSMEDRRAREAVAAHRAGT